MITLLLNDTSDYHSGCKEVMDSYEFTYSIRTNEPCNINLRHFDRVILNGEGTMHHDQQNSHKFLDVLREAQHLNLYTEIDNSVWQKMTNEYDDVLHRLDKLTVREVLSRDDLWINHNVESEVRADRSFIRDVEAINYDHVRIYEGQYFFFSKPSTVPRINIFTQSWDEIINRLRNADLLITGRHHEMYAAIKAKCRFICVPSNTHKIEGLLKSAGCTVDLTDIKLAVNALNGEYDDEYKKIQDFCAKTRLEDHIG